MNKLHALPKAQIQDVAAVLRKIADEIDQGDYDTVLAGAVVLRSKTKEVHVFSCGDTSEDKALALLTRGVHFLVSEA